jgi:membrane-bound lytic murein transglycosylase A
MTFAITTAASAIDETITPIEFADLPGWEDDDHRAAFDAFLKSCDAQKGKKHLSKEVWKPLCRFAKTNPEPKEFFELMFQPVVVGESNKTLFTGYYEPTIEGSRTRGGKYQTPIYKKPPELVLGKRWKSRGEIQAGALNGRGLELAWLADPVEAFFLQIQGSGRISLPDGSSMRVGFAAKNGHKYSSVGQEMIRQGLLAKSKASAQNIKSFVRKNPTKGRELLAHNKSYVFFRELKNLKSSDGPLGAMGVSVSDLRTLAVDPRFNPLGMPIYIDKQGRDPLQRLMIAQDIGSAIKGAQRADIYYGTGKKAGNIAGRTKATGRMYLLLPIESAMKFAEAK